MNDVFIKIFKNVETWIEHYEKENDLKLDKTKIVIMGQLALLLHPDTKLNELDLAATRDLDAKIKGPFPAFQELKKQLEQFGFTYDTDSEKVWLPKNYTTTNIHQSVKLSVDVVDPIFILVSKAIKAKEKNKKLIQQAIIIFKDDLKYLIKKEGGNLEDF